MSKRMTHQDVLDIIDNPGATKRDVWHAHDPGEVWLGGEYDLRTDETPQEAFARLSDIAEQCGGPET